MQQMPPYVPSFTSVKIQSLVSVVTDLIIAQPLLMKNSKKTGVIYNYLKRATVLSKDRKIVDSLPKN